MDINQYIYFSIAIATLAVFTFFIVRYLIKENRKLKKAEKKLKEQLKLFKQEDGRQEKK